MTSVADLIIRHICERETGGPDKLDQPDAIVTTVAELREAIDFALTPVVARLEWITINRGDHRERFNDAVAMLKASLKPESE